MDRNGLPRVGAACNPQQGQARQADHACRTHAFLGPFQAAPLSPSEA